MSWLPNVKDDFGAQVVLLSDIVGAAKFTGTNSVTQINPTGNLGDLLGRADAPDEASIARPIDIDLPAQSDGRFAGGSEDIVARVAHRFGREIVVVLLYAGRKPNVVSEPSAAGTTSMHSLNT